MPLGERDFSPSSEVHVRRRTVVGEGGGHGPGAHGPPAEASAALDAIHAGGGSASPAIAAGPARPAGTGCSVTARPMRRFRSFAATLFMSSAHDGRGADGSSENVLLLSLFSFYRLGAFDFNRAFRKFTEPFFLWKIPTRTWRRRPQPRSLPGLPRCQKPWRPLRRRAQPRCPVAAVMARGVSSGAMCG